MARDCPVRDWSGFDLHLPSHRKDAEASWEEMRGETALPHSDKYGGYYVLTRHDHVREAAARYEVFTSAEGVALPDEARTRHIPEEVDPPLQRSYRRILDPFLSRDAVAAAEPLMRGHARALLDELRGKDRIEFVSMVSEPFPVRVSLDAFGFPAADAPKLFDMVQTLIARRADGSGKIASEALTAYLMALLQERAKPSAPADVITAIAKGEVDGAPMSIDDKVSMTRLLLFGGFTTVNLALSYSVYLLARQPELARTLRSDPESYTLALEEFIRLSTPATYLRRTATKEHRLGDTVVKPGEQVLLCFGAANRDPAVFEAPEEVRLTRNPNPHLGFGFGAHRCAGSQFGKAQLRIMLEELFARYSAIELDPAGAIQWGSGETQGLTALPLLVRAA
ncbi:cytochrome P450 [Terricaulis sp.]|uniref:cytochrome P450 n=1 Tax=Terricaulis sp. TaxID=2768686 RepID=UPI003783E431